MKQQIAMNARGNFFIISNKKKSWLQKNESQVQRKWNSIAFHRLFQSSTWSKILIMIT